VGLGSVGKASFSRSKLGLRASPPGKRNFPLPTAFSSPSISSYGDVTELRDAGGGPRKSSLFFLTVGREPRALASKPEPDSQTWTALESVYPEIRSDGRQSALLFEASGAPSSVRENRRERMIFPPGSGMLCGLQFKICVRIYPLQTTLMCDWVL
jgi:hypothetical protein